MYIKSKLKKIIAASLMTSILTLASDVNLYEFRIIPSIVYAEVKTYKGVGESIISDRETLETGKEGAKLQAVKDAQEQAGIFVSSITEIKNNMVTKDEIIAFTSGIININDNVKYELIPLNDTLGTAKYRATVFVTIDTNDLSQKIHEWQNRSIQDRSNIIEQNKELKNMVDEQAKRIKELELLVANAKTSQDQAEVRSAIAKIDNSTKVIQKNAEGNKFYYEQKYSAAADSYADALKFVIEGSGVPPKNVVSRAQGRMLARRAAVADAYRNLAQNITNYLNARSTKILNDDEVRIKIAEIVKNAIIISEAETPDGYKVTFKLQDEDVQKLKAFLN